MGFGLPIFSGLTTVLQSILFFPFPFYIVVYSLLSQVVFMSSFSMFVGFFYFRTKRLGLVVKVLALISLPLPLLLWPILAIVGSLLGGLGYGFFAPLVATFEAAGETTTDKFFYCFIVSSPFSPLPLFLESSFFAQLCITGLANDT